MIIPILFFPFLAPLAANSQRVSRQRDVDVLLGDAGKIGRDVECFVVLADIHHRCRKTSRRFAPKRLRLEHSTQRREPERAARTDRRGGRFRSGMTETDRLPTSAWGRAATMPF